MPALASLSQEDLDALAAEQAPVPPPGAPPQPAYVATDPGYDVAYPGPPEQPAYIPTAVPEPLPQSPSMAGPPAPSLPPPRYGTSAPTGNTIVTTSYPATGATTVMTKQGAVQPYYPIQVAQTYRTIPPEGSTYPSRETAYGVPPRDMVKLQSAYHRGAYPDLEPRYAGEGPLGEGPPTTPNRRQAPYSTISRLVMPFYRGEGNMGYGDPLAPYTDRPMVGVGGYALGMGETTPFTTWVPGGPESSPYTPEQDAQARARAEAAGHAEMLPPPGYVPEMWNPKGVPMSSYWLARAPEPRVIPTPQTATVGRSTPPPVDLPALLRQMELARKQRRLAGLFGSDRRVPTPSNPRGVPRE